ncbi:MAG: hypothetical protein J7L66_06175 [Anaerolineaceae bacterium]|nr:hypothetical protein [Anaerolineaceae bacterium]
MNYKKKFLLLAFICFFMILLVPSPAAAEGEEPDQVNIYFFWGEGCPHCEGEKLFLNSLIEKYPQAHLVEYEVWHNPDNLYILEQFSEVLGFNPSGVPVAIIGDQFWIGFSEKYETAIESALQDCLAGRCDLDVGSAVSEKPEELPQAKTSDYFVNLPLIGLIDLEKHSLAVGTMLIGFIDGLTPCSFLTLSILLAIILACGSRTKILVSGLTFLITAGIVYGLIIAGIINFDLIVEYLAWIRAAMALIACVLGAANLKKYFWYQESGTFAHLEKHKSKTYKKLLTAAVGPRTIIGLIGFAAALAFGASSVEFSCNSELPAIWNDFMVARQAHANLFYVLLALYLFAYLIVKLMVFLIAIYTIRINVIEEKHNRHLKLISGIVLLFLGLVMAFNPELMDQFKLMIFIFLLAFLTAELVYFIHQKVLPKKGIYIGTGFGKTKQKKRKRH